MENLDQTNAFFDLHSRQEQTTDDGQIESALEMIYQPGPRARRGQPAPGQDAADARRGAGRSAMTPLAKRMIAENRGAIVIVALGVAGERARLHARRPPARGEVQRRRRSGRRRRERTCGPRSASSRRPTRSSRARPDADEELDAFYKKVLPSDMTSARRMTYASLPALARKTGVRYETRTTTIETGDRAGHLEKMSIRMVLEGDYDNLRQFIYALEVAPEFVIIDDVTLVEGLRRRVAPAHDRPVHLLQADAECLVSDVG